MKKNDFSIIFQLSSLNQAAKKARDYSRLFFIQLRYEINDKDKANYETRPILHQASCLSSNQLVWLACL